jgi:hypothetical protein
MFDLWKSCFGLPNDVALKMELVYQHSSLLLNFLIKTKGSTLLSLFWFMCHWGPYIIGIATIETSILSINACNLYIFLQEHRIFPKYENFAKNERNPILKFFKF